MEVDLPFNGAPKRMGPSPSPGQGPNQQMGPLPPPGISGAASKGPSIMMSRKFLRFLDRLRPPPFVTHSRNLSVVFVTH